MNATQNKTLFLLVLILCITACGSTRNITTFSNGHICVEPPADVLATGVSANVQALIPKIKVDVNANASATTTVTRIRSEIPNLQAVEALEYRMCMAYGNKIIDVATYKEFFNTILPMLQGIKEQGASAEQTLSIEERRSYSGVTNCNTARSKSTAETACSEGGRNYSLNNGLLLVSAKMVTFTHDIDTHREPWPSNARSCDANVIASCEITIKERD